MVDDIAGIHQPTIDLAGNGSFSQARADGLGDLHDGNGLLELAAAAVGERDGNHGKSPLSGLRKASKMNGKGVAPA